MKRANLSIIFKDPVKEMNGFQVVDREELPLKNYRKSKFPNLQIDVDNKEVISTAVVPLDKLLTRDIVCNWKSHKMTLKWQEELAPGLTTGRKPATNLEQVFYCQEQAQEALDKWVEINADTIRKTDPRGCIETDKKTHHGQRVSIYFYYKKLTLTHVAKFAKTGETVYKHEDVKNGKCGANEIDLSHLCHNPKCFLPEHLVFEPTEINIARNDCNPIETCKKHGEYPDCIIQKIN